MELTEVFLKHTKQNLKIFCKSICEKLKKSISALSTRHFCKGFLSVEKLLLFYSIE